VSSELRLLSSPRAVVQLTEAAIQRDSVLLKHDVIKIQLKHKHFLFVISFAITFIIYK
jgi:hypothetical protein